VFEKDFIQVYFYRKWYTSRRRNLQLGFIMYTMLLTALVDLNVAVISGTILFFIARAKFGITDIEIDFQKENQELAPAAQQLIVSGNGHAQSPTRAHEQDSMAYYNKLLVNNKEWVKSKLEADPEFFARLAEGQKPPLLWIGCSDSRVPANEITGTQPGEVFVHRNIANMVVHTDMNMLSVLDYAVNVLHVQHVIVCGHYGCGGVRAAMGHQQFGIIDNWLRHIKDVYRVHQDELEEILNPQQRENRFVELNVLEQVYDLSKTSIIQNSWTTRQAPVLHGWVYDIRNGLIKDLNVTIKSNADIPRVYRFDTTAEQILSGR
jgi:carbonic anhydrase